MTGLADAHDAAPLCLPPRPVGRRPLRALPPGTVDTHFHVFDPGAPLAWPRNYTPQPLTVDDWINFADALGIAYGVLVQPSVYGFDNRVMLAALAAHPDRLRGIAVLPPDTSLVEISRLHRLGVRGIRCNTRNLGGLSFDVAGDFARLIAPFGWSIQFQVLPEQLEALATLVDNWPRLPVVIDHFGFTDPRDPKTVPQLQRLLDSGDCYVKVSGPYRLNRHADRDDIANVAATLAASHPKRLLWGSDWPHTELWDSMPDDADLLDTTETWLGNEMVREHIFARTPHRLFFRD
jgi:predicted TIM-barrel fold metal-dependent hydrolase